MTNAAESWWRELYPQLYGLWYERGYYNQIHVTEAVWEVDLILEMTHLLPGARVLDLGCGIGRHVFELARRGFSVMGLDLSVELLEIAQKLAEEEGLAERVSFQQGDMRQLQAEPSYDLVLLMDCTFGIFANKDAQQIIQTAGCFLRPGGSIFIETMNPFFWVGEPGHSLDFVDEQEKIFCFYEYRWETGEMESQFVCLNSEQQICKAFPPQILRLYTPAELTDLLTGQGFAAPQFATSEGYLIPATARVHHLRQDALLYTVAQRQETEAERATLIVESAS